MLLGVEVRGLRQMLAGTRPVPAGLAAQIATLLTGGDLVLCEIVWIDPPPADLQPLLAEAAAAVARLLGAEALGSP